MVKRILFGLRRVQSEDDAVMAERTKGRTGVHVRSAAGCKADKPARRKRGAGGRD